MFYRKILFNYLYVCCLRCISYSTLFPTFDTFHAFHTFPNVPLFSHLACFSFLYINNQPSKVNMRHKPKIKSNAKLPKWGLEWHLRGLVVEPLRLFSAKLTHTITFIGLALEPFVRL